MSQLPAEELRQLIPAVVGVLVRRGVDFASAEDAVQEALVRALSTWPDDPPRDAKGWLVTAAWRRHLDQVRSDAARRGREVRVDAEPAAPELSGGDDTLQLYFLCAHPSLPDSAAVALTLRAVGGLTTRQIAEAHLVPESTMAQRISRAKRRLANVSLDQPGELPTVLRVLYLVFNQGYSGELDLAEEAIRLARQLAVLTDEPEVDGLLALMLLHQARRSSRIRDSRLVALADQDRSLWDVTLIEEGVSLLHNALAQDRLGQYQAQAAIAALHADARAPEETDWVQIVEWYNELVKLTESPIAQLGRAVAVGEADGAPAGLAALATLDSGLPRWHAASGYLLAKNGQPGEAASQYRTAARLASNELERAHLTREAARLRTAAGLTEGT